MPIDTHDKLKSNMKFGYVPIVKPESIKEERKPGMFYIEDFDDPFFCSSNKVPVNKEPLIITVKELI